MHGRLFRREPVLLLQETFTIIVRTYNFTFSRVFTMLEIIHIWSSKESLLTAVFMTLVDSTKSEFYCTLLPT